MRYRIEDIEYAANSSPFTGVRGNKRNEVIRAILFALIGGEKCRWCGCTENVQFDHIYRSDKKFDVNKLVTGRLGKHDVTEILVCQPLCLPCHRIKTSLEVAPRPRTKRQAMGYPTGPRTASRHPDKVSAKAAYDRARNLAKKGKTA